MSHFPRLRRRRDQWRDPHERARHGSPNVSTVRSGSRSPRGSMTTSPAARRCTATAAEYDERSAGAARARGPAARAAARPVGSHRSGDRSRRRRRGTAARGECPAQPAARSAIGPGGRRDHGRCRAGDGEPARSVRRAASRVKRVRPSALTAARVRRHPWRPSRTRRRSPSTRRMSATSPTTRLARCTASVSTRSVLRATRRTARSEKGRSWEPSSRRRPRRSSPRRPSTRPSRSRTRPRARTRSSSSICPRRRSGPSRRERRPHRRQRPDARTADEDARAVSQHRTAEDARAERERSQCESDGHAIDRLDRADATPTATAGLIAIASGIEVVGESAAFSPDGTWFAFTAHPADQAGGADVYAWRVGSERALRVTDDGSSYFASWADNDMIVSRPADTAATKSDALSVRVDPANGNERRRAMPGVRRSIRPASARSSGSGHSRSPTMGRAGCPTRVGSSSAAGPRTAPVGRRARSATGS